jgi:hypothetical protein
MVSREDIGWWAGIMDGEGYISEDKRTGYYRFGVGNTSIEIIKKLAKILLDLDIFFSTYEYKTQTGRPHFVLVICRLLDVKRACSLVKPYINRLNLKVAIEKVEAKITAKNCRKNSGFASRKDKKLRTSGEV